MFHKKRTVKMTLKTICLTDTMYGRLKSKFKIISIDNSECGFV